MKSKIINVWDYWNVDLGAFKKKFIVNEEAITQEIYNERNRKAQWTSGEAIKEGDIAECSLQSDCDKFKKDKLTIVTGAGLFHKELEQHLIGMKQGETKKVKVEAVEIEVKIINVSNKVLPEFTDEFVQSLMLEDIIDIQSYKEKLISEQKKKFIDEIEHPAIRFVLSEVSQKSDILLKKEDWSNWVQQGLDRIRVLAREENLELETMTKEDFEGKIPVSSYAELLAMMQRDAWENVEECVLGQYYLKGEEPYNTSTYDDYICEYAKYWHSTYEKAKEINTYDAYVNNMYGSYYWEIVQKYVEQNILITE